MLSFVFWGRLISRLKREGLPGPSIPPLSHGGLVLLFWGGLRGALSLALVLAVPLSIPSRGLLVISTYTVVLFTLLVQGFCVRWILQRMSRIAEPVQSSSPEEKGLRGPLTPSL